MKKLLLISLFSMLSIGQLFSKSLQENMFESCYEGDKLCINGEVCSVISKHEYNGNDEFYLSVVCKTIKQPISGLLNKIWTYKRQLGRSELTTENEVKSEELTYGYVLTPLGKIVGITALCAGGHCVAKHYFGSDYLSKMNEYIFGKKDELTASIKPAKDAVVEAIKPLYDNVSATVKPIAEKIGAFIKPAITKSTEVAAEAVKTVTESTK